MEDKDYIKDLFSEKLQGFEAKVDPSVWTGVQSQLGANTAVGATTGIALGTKIAAVIGGIAILSTASYFIFSGNEDIKPQVAVQEVNEKIIIPKEVQKEEIKENTIAEKTKTNSEKTISSITEKEVEIIELDDTDLFVSSAIIDPIYEPEKKNISTGIEDEKEVIDLINTPASSNYIVDTIKLPISTIIAEKIDANRYLFVSSNNEVDYVEWNFGDGNFSNEKETQHVFNSPGKYDVALTVYKGDEKTTVNHQIEIKQAGEFKEFPNVFSPNNDGVNDLFSIESENISEFNLTVFNQKGEMVYKTDDLNFRWTGDDEPEGQYYYIIMAKDSDGVMFNEYQQLEIIRTKR